MMKRILMIVVVSVLSFSADAQINSAKLQASGLTCAMCARAVYKNLEALPFVEKIDTDLNGSSFLLDFKGETSVDIDAIRKKVEDAGFSVAALDLTGSFQEVTVKPDQHLTYGGSFFHFVGVKEQTIRGDKTFRVIDKHFTSAKEHKKFQGMTSMECIKTGLAAGCCKKNGDEQVSRIYHVTL
jgi:copper chaperone CopZ